MPSTPSTTTPPSPPSTPTPPSTLPPPSADALCAVPSPISYSVVPELVRRAQKEAADDHGLTPDAKEAYLKQCRILAVEVVRDDIHSIIGYRRIAGQMGGLNKAKMPYLKRIILAVDGPLGVYGAADLHNNVHYQVGVVELTKFCKDLDSLGISVYDAASGSADFPDGSAVLCLPNVSNCLPDEYFSVGSADAASQSFQSLDFDAIFEYMAGLSPDVFDSDRGNLAIHYGYQALNSTVTDREDLCNFASPSLSKPTGPGWSEGSTLADDLAAAMVAMTLISDDATSLHEMDPLFGANDRVSKYAARIHPQNRAESLTMSLSPSDGSYLLAHLDNLNDSVDGYNYNVSFYGYYRDSVSGRYRRMHIGIYSRRVCGTTAARSGRAVDLLDDLTAFLTTLPSWRVNYNPQEIMDHAVWETEQVGPGIPTYRIGKIPVHVDKQVLYSFYASTILNWIQDRARSRTPASVPEVVDAVYSIAMTPSPRSWRKVFIAVTSNQGVSVSKKGQRIPSYKHKVPLTVLWLQKALVMNGGSVGAGAWRRFQPSLARDFHVEKIYSSLRNLMGVVEMTNSANDDAERLHSHAIACMRKSTSLGGLHGVGDLQGHHILSVLACLRIIDDAEFCNVASICAGNSTTKFLCEEYRISTKSHRDQLMTFLGSSNFGLYGRMPKRKVENSTCELGRNTGHVGGGSDSDAVVVDRPWCDVLYSGMKFFDVQNGSIVAKRQVDHGCVSAWEGSEVNLKVVSSANVAGGVDWWKSMPRSDRPTSTFVVDAPVDAVLTHPWWKANWTYSDGTNGSEAIIRITNKQVRTMTESARKLKKKENRSISASKSARVRVDWKQKSRWRCTPPKDSCQRKQFTNCMAPIIWKLANSLHQRNMSQATEGIPGHLRRFGEVVEQDRSIDLSAILDDKEMQIFTSAYENMVDDPREKRDEFISSLYRVATGSSSSRRKSKKYDDDETYDPMEDGGGDDCVSIVIEGERYLRFSSMIRLTDGSSSVVEPVGIVRDALKMSANDVSSSNFHVRSTANGRYYTCELKLGEEAHLSNEAVFPRKGSAEKSHFSVGAVANEVASAELGVSGPVYRSKNHAAFAAAIVAVQKNNPTWFERIFLMDATRSFRILYLSAFAADNSYGQYTRSATRTKKKNRHDPVAFLVRRGDAVVWLDAAAMRQKDLLETNGAQEGKFFDPVAKRMADLLTEEYSEEARRYVPMQENRRLAMEDCWSGKKVDLITMSSVSSSTCFQLSQSTAVVARKVMQRVEEYPFVPRGWVIATTERLSGSSKGGHDDYFFSPRGYRFRSKPEVERFLRCIKAAGNEHQAKVAYENGRCMESPSVAKKSSSKRKK